MSKTDGLRVADYLEHIVKAIERIHRYVEDVSEASSPASDSWNTQFA